MSQKRIGSLLIDAV